MKEHFFDKHFHANYACDILNNLHALALVLLKADSAFLQINHYPEDSVVCFVNTYSVDSDLSGG